MPINNKQNGVNQVYGKLSDGAVVITLCVEDHRYEPNNYWNGRWRSEWCATVDTNGGNAQVVGILKNQVNSTI